MSGEETKRETIEAFIKRMGVTFKATPIDARPDKGDSITEDEKRWQREAFHFIVTFKRGVKSFATFYSMGKGNERRGHDGRMGPPVPKGPEVLDALLSDAESWDNARKIGASAPDIDTFAREMGYDDVPSDTYGAHREHRSFIERYRECERAFNACGETHAALVQLFGAEGFESLRACERM